jgi:hypothetical protein
LKLENQQRVIPIGILKNTTTDLDGVCTTIDFEVMDMVDESIPFPALLGIDWAFDNQAIINLKTRKMIFEAGNFRVVAPLDPSYCERYVEPVPDSVLEDDVNQLYRTTARDEDYVNPTTDGVLSWRSINSDMSDSDTGVENGSKYCMKVSTRRCTRVTRAVRWVGTEVRQFPTFTEEDNLENFLTEFESEVLDSQRLLVLDIALRDTPAQWWGAHKKVIQDWYQCKRLMRIRFGRSQQDRLLQKYDGRGNPRQHIDDCVTNWRLVPPEEWTHYFIHTLEGIPSNWYKEQELRRETVSWGSATKLY